MATKKSTKKEHKYPEIYLSPNAEQAAILMRALDNLPEGEKRGVVFQRMHKQVSDINTVWKRRIKNEKLAKGDIQPKKPPRRRWSTPKSDS